MKILVTGATGFIGRHLIPILLKTKHSIIATSRSMNKTGVFSRDTQITCIQYDMNDRQNDLFNLFHKPDLVIHTAWDNLPDYHDKETSYTNLANSRHFIEGMIVEGLNRIVVTGTCFEYGLHEGCLSEDLEPEPVLEYAKSKLELLQEIEQLNRIYDIEYKWLRLFYIYGKNDRKKSIITSIENAASKGEKFFRMSKGDQLRDFLSIETACEYIYRISVQDRINGIINCCSGSPVELKNFIQNYIIENGLDIKLETGVLPYNDYEPKSFWGDINKMKYALSQTRDLAE